MRIRSVLLALFMGFAAGLAPASLAQDRPAAGAPEAPADTELKNAARGLIEDALKASHAAEIFADLRRTLREVYIPAFRDMVQGGMPGVPDPDAKTAAQLAKLLTVLDYVRKAGDELDVALSENREAMISDAAGQIAKTAKPFEIKDVQDALNLPVVRKGLDAFYAMTKLVTGFSYQDSRTFSEFSAWASRQNLDLQSALPGAPSSGAVPDKRKIAKAQALVNDLLLVSHVDEMVADVKRFVRDVYAETAPMSEEDRQDLRGQADQFEFLYNVQKSVALAAAPSVVAAALSDEQLAAMHGFVRSPAFAKAFDLLRDAVRAGTAFTKEDILEAQKAFEKLEKNAKLREKKDDEPDERAKAEWDAMIEKWADIIGNRISPETRSGLERSIEDLKDESSPI
jgi:hypothetical protein